MTQPRTKVLVVDDSATMRQLIRMKLRADTRIEVVGEASDANEARDAIARLSPDVLTLDVEMPGQSGLDFLKELMASKPLPVIMVSSETQKGSAAAVEALSRGAIDCIGKPKGGDFGGAFANLTSLVLMAAGAKLRRSTAPAAATAPPGEARQNFVWNRKTVLIGSSTGGVDALETLIAGLPANCPPILITQHMPESFLASFAQRLNSRFAPQIQLARNGSPIEQGHVYLAPGGAFHLAVSGTMTLKCQLIEGDKVSGHRPSVDVLFGSAVPVASRIVAVMLTGMGQDGAENMLALRSAGARCIAQDEASSVVWGMPRVAWQNGAAERLVPLSSMTEQILALTGRGAGARQAAG